LDGEYREGEELLPSGSQKKIRRNSGAGFDLIIIRKWSANERKIRNVKFTREPGKQYGGYRDRPDLDRKKDGMEGREGKQKGKNFCWA